MCIIIVCRVYSGGPRAQDVCQPAEVGIRQYRCARPLQPARCSPRAAGAGARAQPRAGTRAGPARGATEAPARPARRSAARRTAAR